MANPIITQNENTPLFIGEQIFEDQTILANENPVRGQVMGAILAGALTVTPSGTIVGDGTLTEEALAAGGPAKVGTWRVECIEAILNSGRFKLTDPDGVEVANDILIPAGPGNFIVHIGAGLTFKITDGATDFALGDYWDIAVAAGSGYLKKTDSTSVDGSEIPKYVYTGDDLTNTSDVLKSVAKSGKVDGAKLVFEGSDTLATLVNDKSMKDWLHERDIITKESSHLDFPDNQ